MFTCTIRFRKSLNRSHQLATAVGNAFRISYPRYKIFKAKISQAIRRIHLYLVGTCDRSIYIISIKKLYPKYVKVNQEFKVKQYSHHHSCMFQKYTRTRDVSKWRGCKPSVATHATNNNQLSSSEISCRAVREG